MESFLVALGVVFLAELGDKTQLVILGLAARNRAAPVVAGALAAYALTQGLSAAAGGALGAVLPERAVGVGAGLLFLAFAARTLRGREGADDDARPRAAAALSVAVAVAVAELGDKTMLATAALAARQDPLATWLGGTAGIALAGLAAV
ncbi:MAG TPA: TMEM165/GDT1 family protein, partial [Actinomycetota bacterium]|nr:TMEM165/GDT1 family protein [Actinomycetota bacterium]